MHICIFEDQNFLRLLPLVYFRPVYNLRCGITSLRERIIRNFNNPGVTLHVRQYLTNKLKRDFPGYLINEIPPDINKILYINGRVLLNEECWNQIKNLDFGYVLRDGENIVAAMDSGEILRQLSESNGEGVFSGVNFEHLNKIDVSTDWINYPWDLINNNGKYITIDFDYLTGSKPTISGKIGSGVYLINESQIHVAATAVIKPGVVIDAEGGPVYIADNVKILPNSVIDGPVAIGNKSVIKAGAKIYEDTSIGTMCKVGGEVEASIIHSYSNKQHEGFLGHAYIGSWVNIGAGTNNSDLKNDYSTVKVYMNGKLVDSGSMFVGVIMGDHSKTGINTMFNTGTVVGVNCNIYGTDFPPQFVPSFSWGSIKTGFSTYRIEKAINVAINVFKRRKIKFDNVDENLFKALFNLTEKERRQAGIKI